MAEGAAPFEGKIWIPIKPIRGQRQVAELARSHFYIADASRFYDTHADDVDGDLALDKIDVHPTHPPSLACVLQQQDTCLGGIDVVAVVTLAFFTRKMCGAETLADTVDNAKHL